MLKRARAGGYWQQKSVHPHQVYSQWRNEVKWERRPPLLHQALPASGCCFHDTAEIAPCQNPSLNESSSSMPLLHFSWAFLFCLYQHSHIWQWQNDLDAVCDSLDANEEILGVSVTVKRKLGRALLLLLPPIPCSVIIVVYILCNLNLVYITYFKLVFLGTQTHIQTILKLS